MELMAHYGDDKSDVIVSYNEDSDEENEYFDPKPRRLNFDHSINQNIEGDDGNDDNVSKSSKKKKKVSGDEEDKNLVCDICKKTFEKRWALNSHMLVHSRFVICFARLAEMLQF